jgi:hypothetical protein
MEHAMALSGMKPGSVELFFYSRSETGATHCERNPSMNSDRMISDLPARVAGGFTAARGVGEGWIPVTWETAELQGTGLAAGAGSGATELAIELNLRGPYTVHVALGSCTGLRVWLDGDPAYREFVTRHGGNALQECRLHTADLTGRRLCVGIKDDLRPQPAFLGYVRVEPGTATHRSARNLIATNDGFSWVAVDGIASARDVSRYFAAYRDSDFGLMLWGPEGADVTGCHATRVGTPANTDTGRVFRECDRNHARQFASLLKNGQDLLTAAVENAPLGWTFTSTSAWRRSRRRSRTSTRSPRDSMKRIPNGGVATSTATRSPG